MSQSLYLHLDPAKIIETAERLRNRIVERFPPSGLGKVAGEVCLVARASAARASQIAKPNLLLQIATIGLTLVLAVVALQVIRQVNVGPIATSVADLIQAFDAAIEAIVICCGGIAFLLTLETRLKRRKALRALHELRSVAHVIDMHQLTKDPERVLNRGESTLSSPERILDPFALSRYLDYCSELLSIVSKVAALYLQYLPDPIVLTAVDEIESLTNGLSRKIWQKIMIVDRMNRGSGNMSSIQES